jgi:ketopantoate reductase
MEKKKIVIIGVGGRTGTMFAFEIAKVANVLGVARENEINKINEKKLCVDKGKGLETFNGKVTKDTDFSKENSSEIIFLATKNPVSAPLSYYFQKCSKKPIFVISQNGIDAAIEAEEALRKITDPEKIRLVRMVLFNAIDKKIIEGKDCFRYSTPVRVAVAGISNDEDSKEVIAILKKAEFKVSEFTQKDIRNLEYSKLFLNLIGMASASRGLSIKEGFKDKEIFKEEIDVLREYINSVKAAGGKFLNFFPYYPVGILSLISYLPTFILVFCRNILAQAITKGRAKKRKDLDEIDYYNGAVIKLGKKGGIETPANNRIYSRIKK